MTHDQFVYAWAHPAAAEVALTTAGAADAPTDELIATAALLCVATCPGVNP